jgi:sec-independent protein translocase protein TatB
MLNLGWSELFFIMILSILVIGPNEIPSIMRNLGRVARRLSYLKFALSQQFEDFLKEHDLHDLKDLRHEVNFEARNHEGVEFHEAEFDEDHTIAPLEKEHD